MVKKIQSVLGAIFFFLWFSTGTSNAASIDLNDFFFFPGDPVIVAADGSSATIGEDPFFSPITLSNDPFLGDPEVIIAGVGVSLFFDYDFMEGISGEDDEFGAFVIDPLTGLSLGLGFEFFTVDTSSGTGVFDLTGLAGTSGLGLQFQLSALAGDSGLLSTVTISNVRLETASVPEPASLLLLSIGIVGISVFRNRLVSS